MWNQSKKRKTSEMATAKKHPKGVTPKGIASWPHLNKPDEFKGARTYKTGLILSADDAEPLIERIKEETDKVVAETRERLQEAVKNGKTGEAKAKARKALEALNVKYPYTEAVDSDGNPTGDVLFRFKANSEFKDPKTGEMRPIRIALFDAKGKPTKVAIWGGSEIRVAFAFVGYHMVSTNDVGVSLRIEGVKVIKPADASAGRSAAGFGFGEEEDGFDGSEGGGDDSGFGDDDSYDSEPDSSASDDNEDF